MKKIFTIIAMLIAVAANAQLKSNFTTFKLGGYVFYSLIFEKAKGGGTYSAHCSDTDEAAQLKMFLNNNKQTIEKKFDVVLKYVYREGTDVEVLLYDRNTYEKYMKEEEDAITRQNIEKAERLESLNRVIAPDSPTRKNISVYLHCD